MSYISQWTRYWRVKDLGLRYPNWVKALFVLSSIPVIFLVSITISYTFGLVVLNILQSRSLTIVYSLLLSLVLLIALLKRIHVVRTCLTRLFPGTFGYRKGICAVSISSKPLRDILLSIDEYLPSEDKYQKLQEQFNNFLNDVKVELEDRMITNTFSSLFVGSVAERFGIPIEHGRLIPRRVDALLCDVDVMLCCDTFEASFSGQGNIHIKELDTNRTDNSAYCQVNFQGQNSHQKLIKPKAILDNIKDAVLSSKATNLPRRSICLGPCVCCCETIDVNIKGPTIKFVVSNGIEGDITLCIRCIEWPPLSDWPIRERLWPSRDDVERITSDGIHLVAKPLTPQNKEQELPSWRFSFSLPEVELSKLLPSTARKCFMALKIIFKDHLQTILPNLSSYHMKTIFLNTLEKKPEKFWVDENIEECFALLLEELHTALESGCCNHYWLRNHVNLFDFQNKTDKKRLSILARKVKKIQENPAPYINDDSCCGCLCCVSKTNVENEQTLLVVSEYEMLLPDIV